MGHDGDRGSYLPEKKSQTTISKGVLSKKSTTQAMVIHCKSEVTVIYFTNELTILVIVKHLFGKFSVMFAANMGHDGKRVSYLPIHESQGVGCRV
jgi:hypothetical protein